MRVRQNQSIKMIDTHIHLNDIAPQERLPQLLQRAQELGVKAWIVPATTDASFVPIMAIIARYQHCYPALGLHPWFLPKNINSAIEDLKSAIEYYSPIAIGECGLDFSRENYQQQMELFEAQVALAVEFQLPLIIHSYKAVDAVLQVLRRYPDARGVFHGINCSLQQLTQIIDLGFFIGFGGAVTYPRAKRLGKLLQATPLSHLLLETDAPFQAGVYRQKDEAHLPEDLVSIAHFIAQQKSLELIELAKITTENAIHLFNLEIE